MSNHDDWAKKLLNHLCHKTVSPMFIFRNLQKLDDCLSSPDIQPFLCKWIGTIYGKVNAEAADTIQEHIARSIRLMQMHVLAQGRSVSILNRMPDLMSKAKVPMHQDRLNDYLVEYSILRVDDITLKKNTYSTFLGPLGDRDKMQHCVSLYQKNFAKFLKTERIPSTALVSSTTDGAAHCAVHSLLWISEKLDNASKYAIAYDWCYGNQEFNTRAVDRILAPKKTETWERWAEHASAYMMLHDHTYEDLAQLMVVLQDCPQLEEKKVQGIAVEAGFFHDDMVI